MLEATQKTISIRQLAALELCDEGTICETPETHERMRHTQPIVATTVGELERLRNELDLANAAATEFHIEAALLLCLSIDLLLRKTNTRERTADRDVRTKDHGRHSRLES